MIFSFDHMTDENQEFARGAQVLNAGLPFHLEGQHFPKIVFLGG